MSRRRQMELATNDGDLDDPIVSEIKEEFCKRVIPSHLMRYLPCLTKEDIEKVQEEEEKHGSMHAADVLLQRLVQHRDWLYHLKQTLLNPDVGLVDFGERIEQTCNFMEQERRHLKELMLGPYRTFRNIAKKTDVGYSDEAVAIQRFREFAFDGKYTRIQQTHQQSEQQGPRRLKICNDNFDVHAKNSVYDNFDVHAKNSVYHEFQAETSPERIEKLSKYIVVTITLEYFKC